MEIIIKIIFCFVYLIIIIKFINKYHSFINSIPPIKLCLCTLGKAENRYIREFISYYKNYGVDKIFLYDNNDENGEHFEEIINDYIKEGFVQIYDWRGKNREQLNILNHCYLNNYEKFDWLMFYDLDEYINLTSYSNIKDFLNQQKFKRCQVIYLNWIIHTDNNLMYYDNRTLHERFPIIEPNAKNKITKEYMPVKSILKGHIPNIKINCLHLLNANSTLKSCNGFGDKPKLILHTMKPDFNYYFIDHYYFKSLDEFTYKLNRGSAKTYNESKIKLLKVKRYILMNEINNNKLNYLANKTKINLTEVIEKLNKPKKKHSKSIFRFFKLFYHKFKLY